MFHQMQHALDLLPLQSKGQAGAGALCAQVVQSPRHSVELVLGSFLQFDWTHVLWPFAGAVGALVAGRACAALLLRIFSRWSGRTDTAIDDAIVKHLSRPIRWLLPVVALGMVLPMLRVPAAALASIQHVVLIASIVGVGWALVGSVHVVEDIVKLRFSVAGADNLRARTVQTQFRGFRNIAVFVIAIVTIAFVLTTFQSVRQLGAGLLASAGVAGIVIGFAAQKTIATMLAGIQIALSQPIRVDDVVIVENEWGVIEEITLTYVVVRIWDLRRLVVPIAYFIEKPFQNWTRVSADVLGTVNLYLDYGAPVEVIRQELKRLLDASDKWDTKTWGLQVTDTSERTMTLRALMSARTASDAWDLRCEVRERLVGFIQRNYPDALPRWRGEVKADLPASTEVAP